MYMNRPLLDIYIIEVLDRIPGTPKGSFAMLHRVHHAAVDGASGAHAFIAMSDIDANGTPAIAEPPPVEELGKAPSSAETLSRAWGASIKSPVKLLNAKTKQSPEIGAAAPQVNTHTGRPYEVTAHASLEKTWERRECRT